MRVATPTVSWHNRERVSSLDFQPVAYPCQTPNGTKSGYPTRLATAGDDKHVLIWELTIDDSGKVEPMCLCDLNRHQNSVNVVRWSNHGRLLASGDTDSTIYVWQYEEKEAPPDIFGEEGVETIRRENWSILKCLRGHLQDVVGIAWSPDSNFIFSCSTDGTAIVFNVKKGDKVKILSDHNGWVNGVVWDPKNKHVATIASDRCLRLFGTKSFNYARKVRTCKLSLASQSGSSQPERNFRLFHDDTFMSFYRRLDFSPDGELLAIPSGVIDADGLPPEAKVPHCTHLFSRLNYTKPIISLPGKEFSVCVRFSPIKYTLRPVLRKTESSSKQTDKQTEVWEKYETMLALPYRMVFAIATQNTVTFYDTQQCEPFAQVSRIHYVGLNDISWAPDGQTLLVASTDGFCSVVNFKDGEIGETYDENATTVTTTSQQTTQAAESIIKSPPATMSKEGVKLNREGVASLVASPASQIKIRSVKEGGKSNPHRLQLITLSSPSAADKKAAAAASTAATGTTPSGDKEKKRVALTPVQVDACANAAGKSVDPQAEQPVKKRAQLFPVASGKPAAANSSSNQHSAAAAHDAASTPSTPSTPSTSSTSQQAATQQPQKKRATLISLK